MARLIITSYEDTGSGCAEVCDLLELTVESREDLFRNEDFLLMMDAIVANDETPMIHIDRMPS